MSLGPRTYLVCKFLQKMIPAACFLLLIFPPMIRAQSPSGAAVHTAEPEDFDQYKFRIDAFWFYSNPSGSIQGTADVDTTSIDLQKDLGFDAYSTFSGKVEWKFTRKNHLYVAISPFYTSHETTLNRTITFQGQTFEVGLLTRSDLHAFLVAPGYQYDIIRRKRGHLGISVQADLFNTSAKISAAAQIVNGVQQPAVSASGSLLAPIPVIGPEFRIYPFNSPHFFFEGNVYGMYLFGYGNFVSTTDAIGVAFNRHISLNAGYQLGSRLVVQASPSNDRVGIRLTQQGAVVGAQFSF
jgi:hypothetical protein